MPEAMSLGAIVVGVGTFKPRPAIVLPRSALFRWQNSPAVWLFDPKSRTVTPKVIAIERYAGEQLVLSDGVAPGDDGGDRRDPVSASRANRRHREKRTVAMTSDALWIVPRFLFLLLPRRSRRLQRRRRAAAAAAAGADDHHHADHDRNRSGPSPEPSRPVIRRNSVSRPQAAWWRATFMSVISSKKDNGSPHSIRPLRSSR